MALSTVSGILTRIGMGKLGRLGLEPAQRYERDRPGELIHIDVKKLGRIANGAGHRMTGRRHHLTDRMDAEGKQRRTENPRVVAERGGLDLDRLVRVDEHGLPHRGADKVDRPISSSTGR